MRIRFYITIGFLFILAGALLSSSWLLQYWENRHAQPSTAQVAAASLTPRPANVSNPTLPAGTLTGQPSHITIPRLNISVDVQPGYYNAKSQTWSLSTTAAMFAAVTTPPNNKAGDTFIYGHNRRSVFAALLKAGPGDQVIVTTSNNHTFTYVFASQHDTQPTDVSLFNYQGPPILTLQTCSGMWYQNRRVFIFNLVEAH